MVCFRMSFQKNILEDKILKYKIILLVIIVLWSVFLSAETKIAYVNTDRIFSDYKDIKDAEEILQSDIEKWEQEITEMETEINLLKEEFEEKKLILTPTSKEDAQQFINDKEEELKVRYKEIYGENGEIVQRNNELMEPILNKLTQAIEIVAVEYNYTIVLDSSTGGVLYAKPTIDITDEVMAEMKNITEEE